MADRQAAEAREVIADALEHGQLDSEFRDGSAYNEAEWEQARDALDALSVRLAQADEGWRVELDKRVMAEARLAQAEQERDEWKERAGYERGRLTVAETRLAQAEQHIKEVERGQFYNAQIYADAKAELARAEVRLREYEEALKAYSAFDDVIDVLMDARRVEYARLEAARAALAASGERSDTAEAGGREAP